MSDWLERVGEALEQLDYRVERRDEEVYEAMHEERWNFVYTPDVGGLLLRSSIEAREAASDLELYDLIDEVHAEAAVLRIYLDDDRDLALEAWWPPLFQSEAFEMFIRAWNRDISLIARHPDIDELLV